MDGLPSSTKSEMPQSKSNFDNESTIDTSIVKSERSDEENGQSNVESSRSVSVTQSLRGCDLLIVDNYTFCKQAVLKSGEIHWRCIKKKINCLAKVYTIGPEYTVTRKELNHNHEPDKTKLKRKLVSTLCKRKAAQDVSEEPSKIINDVISTDLTEQLTSTDLNQIRENMHNSYRRVQSYGPNALTACEDLDVKLIASNRGRHMLVVNNYKYSFHKQLKGSEEKVWRCVNRECKSLLYTVGVVAENIPVIIHRKNDEEHFHETNVQSLNRQIVNSACKRKAVEELAEKPATIIKRVLEEDLPMTLTADEMESVRRNMYNIRRKLPPVNMLEVYSKLEKTSDSVKNNAVSVIQSARGTDLLVVDNHTFSKQAALKSGEVHWRCTKKNFNCLAKLYTIGAEYIVTRKELVHNHGPDASKSTKKNATASWETSDQSSAFHPQVDMKTEFEEIEIKSEPIDSLNDYLIDVDRDLKPSSDFDIPVNNSSDFSQEIVFKQEQIYESISDLPADPLQYIQPISTKNEEDMTAQSNLSSDAPTVDSNTNSAIFEDPYFKRVHKPLRLALSRFFPLETAMFREKFEDNEDLLFILTLLADIKCVNKVDRLDLKADVLNVVKRYRNK